MFAAVPPGSSLALVLLGACFVLVLVFEFSNGFHDTANAVATVIYTNSLRPVQAVVWSGLMNFVGVMVGGIAVAYALVEILPPEVLSPPNGDPAIGMLAALFISSLSWNFGTWALGIPNSSSHALIGSLVGVSVASSLREARPLHEGVDWSQIVKVLEALLISPVIGFVGALLLFRVVKLLFKDQHLYEPPEGDTPPVWWLRAILIATCTGVSFAHGSNDGQKSIGLIMLTVIGLAPFAFAINPDLDAGKTARLLPAFAQASVLIARDGGSQKAKGMDAAADAIDRLKGIDHLDAVPAAQRVHLRTDANRVMAELKAIAQHQGSSAPKPERDQATALQKGLTDLVNYVPWWVRVVSAVCLGLGTMVGYKRIVETLGERLGKKHLVPAQGAAAEVVAAAVIGVAGLTGGPVSTTHVVTSGIAGTMVGAGAGVQGGTLRQIALAWILTLPATMLIAGVLFWLLA
jgi:PiT family inorganic phosphate transporter